MICQLNISDKFKSLILTKEKKISFLIIHYTETKTLEQAILLLTDPKRKSKLSLFSRFKWKNF